MVFPPVQTPTFVPDDPAAKYLAAAQQRMAENNAKGPTPYPAGALPAPQAPAEEPVNPPPAPVAPAAPAAPAAGSDLESQQTAALANYAKAVGQYDPTDIISKMRLKTGGVSDIDQRMDELRAEQAGVRPKLMAKYADLDPAQREALISAEEGRVSNEIARYTNLRQDRLGTIGQMIQAEVQDKEKQLVAQQALVQLYGTVLGDKRNAELAQKQLEQGAAQLDLLREQLKQTGLQTQQAYAAAGVPAPVDLSGTGSSKFRTERNLNPTAMTTDVAKSLGLVEGKDYEKGEPFTTGSGTTLYTARMIVPAGKDPIALTVEQFDRAAANGKNIFTTGSGAQRWTHTTGMSNDEWMKLPVEQKTAIVKEMYRKEGNSGMFTGATPIATNKAGTIDGLLASKDAGAVINTFSSQDAGSVLAQATASNDFRLPEEYANVLMAKAPANVANAYAHAANVDEMRNAIAEDTSDPAGSGAKITAAIVNMSKPKSGGGAGLLPSEIKQILQEAGFKFKTPGMLWGENDSAAMKKIKANLASNKALANLFD